MDFMSFVGGCLGGFAGILSSYPFDTIKVRIQNQHVSNEKYRGAIDCLCRTIKKDSTTALYKGVSSPLVGSMFINALLFGVETNVRRRLGIPDNNNNNNNSSGSNKGQRSSQQRPYHLYALSGSIAGLAQSFMLAPIELVKIKMQIPESKYTSTWQCMRDLVNRHCGKSTILMRGTWLTVLRDVPGVGAYFVSFEYICDVIKERRNPSTRESLSVPGLLLAGGFSGCFSWVVTYPIDVIKTRYQADFSYCSVRECIKKSFSSEGHMVFWRGLAPTLLRAFPNNAAVFATVTLFNRFVNNLQLDDDKDDSDLYNPTRLQTEFLMDTYDMHR